MLLGFFFLSIFPLTAKCKQFFSTLICFLFEFQPRFFFMHFFKIDVPHWGRNAGVLYMAECGETGKNGTLCEISDARIPLLCLQWYFLGRLPAAPWRSYGREVKMTRCCSRRAFSLPTRVMDDPLLLAAKWDFHHSDKHTNKGFITSWVCVILIYSS